MILASLFAPLAPAATLPIITAQPQPQALATGGAATFSVSALGDAPLSYEWWNEFGPVYPPQTGATLSLAAVQPSQAGNYFVRVRNPAGTVTSAAAALSVTTTATENFLFARRGIGTGADPGANIDVDSAGNFYVAGSFTGSATFGSFTLTSAGGSDIFVAKYDASGNVVWARRAGGAGNDVGSGVAVDRMGLVHLTGSFSGSAGFGAMSLVTGAASDAFVAALDRDGAVLWARKLGGTATAKAHRIAADAAGNSVAVGSFSGSISAGATTLSSSGSDDVFLAKFSSSGVPLWTKRFGGSAVDRGTGLALDPDGNIFLTGSFQGTAAFGSVNLTSSSGTQTFLARSDRSGVVQWARKVSGVDSAAGTSVIAEDDGTCNLTGTFSATANFDGMTLANREVGERFIAKYDAGAVQWVARSDAAGSQVGLQASDAAVAGPFGSGALDWTGGAGGTVDLLAARFAEPGVAAWAKQSGASPAAFTLGLMADSAGQRYVTGFFEDEDGVNYGGGYSLARIPLANAAGPPPPFISQMPQGQSAVAGGTVSFTVAAAGSVPLSYQWRLNGSDLPGATSSTLTLNNVQVSQAGSYSVVVLNADGSALSAPAQLAVQAPPDTTPPSVAISSPAAGARVNDSAVTLRGTAADDMGLSRVEVQLDSGPVLFASGTMNWSASLTLVPGTNTVRARSVDTSGNTSAWLSRSLVFAPASALAVTISGSGTVTPNLNGQLLEIGATYSMTAVPAFGNEFSGWSGGIVSGSSTLQFVMQQGLALQANFTAVTNSPGPTNSPVATNELVLARATYSGLFHEADAVRHESSGFFSLATAPSGRFTAVLTPGGRRLAISGRFTPDGRATNSVVRSGTNMVTVFIELASSNGVAQARGRVEGSGWESALWAGRAANGSRTNPVPWAGRYTLVIPGADSGPGPFGPGFGAAAVDARGRVSLAATLGDGTRLVQSVPLTSEGHWPLYGNLYGARGSAMSWVTFAENLTEDFAGDFRWTCPASPRRRLFPEGFSHESTLVGSRYERPVGNTNRVVAIESGSVRFEGGNLLAPFSNDFFLTTNNRVVNVSSNKLSLTIVLPSGLFTGRVIDPASQKAVTFKGALLQKRNAGWGNFKGTNQTGRVTFGL